MPQKFPFLATFICACAVAILCALAVWQIERLAWKNELQRNLDAAFAVETPAVFEMEHLKKSAKGQVIRGVAEGRLDLSKAVLFHGRIQDGKSVMSIFAPMIVQPDNIQVMVEVGCGVPELKDIQAITTKKSVRVMGISRQPRWSFATPANIPDKGEWWRADVGALAAHWGISGLENTLITAENSADLLPATIQNISPCPIEKTLRNDHKSYAFFWFSMAGVLSIIWGIRFLKPYLQSA